MKKNKEIKLIDISKIRYSPEIEVELPKNKNSEQLIKRNRILKGWTITSDYSLTNGMEIKPKNSNKLYYNEESLLQLKEILALLKVHRAKVSNSCGLHIHIDCTKLTDLEVLQIIKEFIHKQRYFIKQFNINTKRIEDFCRLLPRENLHKLTEKDIHKFRHNTSDWSFGNTGDYRGCFYLNEKYHSLNASHLRKGDFNTLEFRLYQPTLNYNELKNRIYFTLNFIKESLERE